VFLVIPSLKGFFAFLVKSVVHPTLIENKQNKKQKTKMRVLNGIFSSYLKYYLYEEIRSIEQSRALIGSL